MLNKILSALKNVGIITYLINENQEESVELFFVKKNLDMRRRKDVTKYNVTVYQDFQDGETKIRGASSVNLYSSMSEAEIEEALRDSYYAASFVKNPYFELPHGNKLTTVTQDNLLSKMTLEEAAVKMTEALFEEDNKEEVFLNSAELFIVKNTKHIMNSEGIDVGYISYKVNGEFVTQCLLPSDVETYQSFSYDDLDTEALKEKVKNTLEMTSARASANSAPKAGDYKVIISGQYVRDFMDYYVDKSASYMVYPKHSNYVVGDHVQGTNVTGDRLNITLKAKAPFSEEGIPMIDRKLLENGELKVIHGTSRFAYYLGIEPTGMYHDFIVEEGAVPFEEMKTGKYLHIVNFSDFQMDPLTGYFGGEIRLAFYSDGEKEIPVTGGSISGSIPDVEANLHLSKEMQTEKGYHGPLALYFDKVSVNGVE